MKANNIKLNDKFKHYQERIETKSTKIEALKPISKINIFVGANNSGKSMFMRLLSTMKEFPVHAKSIDKLEQEIKKILPHHEKLVNEFSNIESISYSPPTIFPIDWFKKFFEGEAIGSDANLNDCKTRIIGLRDDYDKLCNLGEGSFTLDSADEKVMISPNKVKEIKQLAENGKKIIDNILDELKDINDIKVNTVYIPVLRGLRPLDNAFTDYYKTTTERDYFTDNLTVNSIKPPDIFTGLGFYNDLDKLKNGIDIDRNKISEYQKFISENLFEDENVVLTAFKDKNGNGKTVLAQIGNETEREIHLLGDGIQSAIILTFLPFVTKESTYFFIEEPEMYLHPGLQRKILEFFNSDECKQHKFFMTTHSNHFLDITIDIKDVSIFTFRKKLQNTSEEFVIEAVDGTDQSSLELLGVRNSSVFLVNATIWVEGITDRWYLRKMLNSYMEFLEKKKKLNRKLEEDVHYCFVEYSGSNITHWSFLNKEDHPIVVKRLCAKAMVVVDDDGGKKAERKKELLEVLTKKNLIVLPCNEIENLLPYKIIKSIVAEYEKVDESELPDINYEFYKDKYLGSFIHENILLNKKPRRKGGYKTDSGTIKDKRIFCEKALDKIEFSKLPNSTQKVIKDIYNFIVKQNS
jgi:AAA15 family ATPase/GTPase